MSDTRTPTHTPTSAVEAALAVLDRFYEQDEYDTHDCGDAVEALTEAASEAQYALGRVQEQEWPLIAGLHVHYADVLLCETGDLGGRTTLGYAYDALLEARAALADPPSTGG